MPGEFAWIITLLDPESGNVHSTNYSERRYASQDEASAAGQHGTFSIDADGKWTYTLTNNDPAVQGLGAGKTLTETFTVTTADGTLVATGKIDVTDIDTTDTHTWSVNDGGKGTYGSFSVAGLGDWTYNLGNANKDVQGLKSGETFTETFTVTVDDGNGGVVSKDVTVTINGTDDGA
ncbi:VCBS domain-containing protein, partial [Achromobacter marplatensis]|uniref:VCBS domain-containing protein n=1 Tax=Achromobacter marplatensis TaxID=470868 RepID=UPI00027804BC